MFERFTEKARRLIFFARFEASQYGSSFIETEHILLGLLREDRGLMRWLGAGYDFGSQMRAEIEKLITPCERISTSVEVPLTQESKMILILAAEESDRLGHKHICHEHLLLGILRLPDSLAGRLLIAKGFTANAIREKFTKGLPANIPMAHTRRGATIVLDGFLSALRDGSEPPSRYFEERGQFIDATGKRWVGREQIELAQEALFAPFGKKNAWHRLEDTVNGTSDTVIASVLWEFAAAPDPAERACTLLRMTIVLAPVAEDWQIVLAQLAPFLPRPNPTR